MKLLYIAFLLVSVSISAWELIPAKVMPQRLDARASFYGGWPIAANSCPSNTTSCNDGSCCPSSTNCYTEGLAGVAVCCPDTNNCVDTVNTLPVCADSSWTLYIGNYYYFCCAPGQIGILPDKGSSVRAGLCVDSSASPAASVRATTYEAAGTTTSSSSSSISSATNTIPSSTTSPTSPSTGGSTSPSTMSSTSPSSAGSTSPSTTGPTLSSTTSPTSTQSSTAKSSANSSPNSGSLSLSSMFMGLSIIMFGL